ncbi:MAG: hypothetical protein AB7G23_19255 [Vicinamibacterales bacterium]
MLDWSTVRDRVPAAAALDQPVVEALIGGAQAFLERQTGRYFGLPTAVTEYLLGFGTVELFLADLVASGTPTVTEQLSPTSGPTAVTGFAQRPGRAQTVLLRTDGFVWRASAEYAVTYQRGFALEAAPADLQQLALDLIAARLNASGAEGLQAGAIGNFSFTLADADLTKAIPGLAATIGAWRRQVAA